MIAIRRSLERVFDALGFELPTPDAAQLMDLDALVQSGIDVLTTIRGALDAANGAIPSGTPAAVETALYQAHLAHAWQGPTLLIREIDEDAVDDIIERIDDTMSTSASAGVDSEDGRLGFDLGARNQDLHAAVVAKLTEEGVEHELMGNGFLLVPTAREDDVGDWIEAIQEEMRASDSFGPGVEGELQVRGRYLMLGYYKKPAETAAATARAERGVGARLRECQPEWCEVEAEGHRGWVHKSTVWGVDGDEIVGR